MHEITPLHFAKNLSHKVGKHIYCKLDNLQAPGSFKIRGIGKLCKEEVDKGAKAFVASSGGNAGIAVAYAAKLLAKPCTVFVPESTHQAYINEIKSYGATVIVAGKIWDDAHKTAMQYQENHKAAYIPPFDHPTLWEGHASIIEESSRQTSERPDAVIVAVGGGGLACGVLSGMHKVGWQDIPLFTAETIGADAFARSVSENKRIALETISSKATSLGAKQICQRLWQWRNEHEITPLTVSDQEAEKAIVLFQACESMSIEMSSGATLAALLKYPDNFTDCNSILLIICGKQIVR